MPFNIDLESFRRFQKLFRWHTREIAKLEQKILETNDDNERERIERVQRIFIRERRRIRVMYPNEFNEDIFDAKF